MVRWSQVLRVRWARLLGAMQALVLLASGAVSCGDVNIDSSRLAGYSYCQDYQARFHFQVLVPPWKYSKEYRCESTAADGTCLSWAATGRYVFVVADVPFVNFDSEIITSLDVEIVSGDTPLLAQQLITSERIGEPDSRASFYGEDSYPRAIEAAGEEELPGHEVLWRELRDFQGSSYNWYRRDVYLRAPTGQVFHLRLFSIDRMDLPEFEALIETFRPGAAPDGAPDCTCRDEHDPSGPRDC